jgi:hypothetical protein
VLGAVILPYAMLWVRTLVSLAASRNPELIHRMGSADHVGPRCHARGALGRRLARVSGDQVQRLLGGIGPCRSGLISL